MPVEVTENTSVLSAPRSSTVPSRRGVGAFMASSTLDASAPHSFYRETPRISWIDGTRWIGGRAAHNHRHAWRWWDNAAWSRGQDHPIVRDPPADIDVSASTTTASTVANPGERPIRRPGLRLHTLERRWPA